MNDNDQSFLPEASGPVGETLKSITVVTLGSGCVLLFLYFTQFAIRPTAGASRSVNIELDKRQAEISEVIAEESD